MTRDELLSAAESDYMNEAQLAFFKALLLVQLEEFNERVESGKARLAELERPIAESDYGLDCRGQASRELLERHMSHA